MKFKEYINEDKERPYDNYYCLNSKSKINIKDPLKNEYIAHWEKNNDKSTFLLLSVETGYQKISKVILAGSGSDYVKKGDKINCQDDGNKTTRLPREKSSSRGSWSSNATVLMIANNAEEIKNFPAGNYPLWVMK
jgi:hypothetical protein